MLKIITVFAALLCLLSEAAAQEQYHNSHFGISGGISIPTGKFAGSDITNPDHGFATTGHYFDFNYGYLIWKNAGITASFRHQSFGSNSGYVTDASLKKAIIHSAAMGWTTNALLLGVTASIPLCNNKIAVEPRGLVGPLLASSSGAFYYADSGWYNLEKVSALSFGASCGVTVSYNLNSKLRFSVSADVLSAAPQFSKEAHPAFGYRQDYFTLNSGFGVAYRFSQPAAKKSLLFLPIW